MITELLNAIDKYASLTIGLSEDQLNLDWAWGDYDSEGIRFSMFRTFEELQAMAVQRADHRIQFGLDISAAQLILAGFHRAYRRLKVVLMNRDPSLFIQSPAPGEWPIHRTISHIYNAEMNFFVVVSYGLARFVDPGLPVAPPDEFWDEKIGMTEPEFDAFLSEPAEVLLTALEALHQQVLPKFAPIPGEALEFGAKFWETDLMPLRFRLHRFESHMRQHTIQIEKNLVQLGHGPGEARRLLYLIYDALAEVENTGFGTPEFGSEALVALADTINQRTEEIRGILEGATGR
jgi:hypothetical protein